MRFAIITVLYGDSTDDFMKFLEKSEKDNNYYVYCRSGKRSHAACEIMAEMGFKNVYNLKGGFIDWVKYGYQVNE